jgi:hypothetical protein
MMTEQEFWDILYAVPETKPVFYRLYYNEFGQPVTYSMEHLPGNYIEIDALTFARSPGNVRVHGGKLVEIVVTRSQKLVPTQTGTKCHAHDISIVVITEPGTHWSKKTYESN